MRLLSLFIASSIPVLKVLLITALGSYLALDRVHVLGADARKHVNGLVFYVFNPALVYSNLAATITSDSLLKLWFMPFNILITFIVGSMLGWIVIQLTRPPQNLRGLIIGCCAAGNMGNMLLILVPAVCKEKGSPFGTPDVCQSYGLAYVSLSMAIGAIYLWSYVYHIVRISSQHIPASEQILIGETSKETATPELESCTEPLLMSDVPEPEEHPDHFALRVSNEKVKIPVPCKFKEKVKTLAGKFNMKSLFAPSTIGAIVGFAIALVPQTRKLMVGNDAPLHVLQDSASLLGDGAIPTVTLILGGNLLKGLKGGSRMRKTVIVGIVVARYIILPLVGIFVVETALRFGLIPVDPLYQFVLLLQFAVPPAMNIGTITQLFGAGESECSVIMLWAYALASISMTFWSTFFMWHIAS